MTPKIETPKIKSTTNYLLFKKLEGNRKVQRGHVKNLGESYYEAGDKQMYKPMIVNGKFEVIDGQHSLEAAMFQKKPIYYVVDHDATLRDAQIYNTYVSMWKVQDFIESYIIQGNKNYQILKDFFNKYKFSFTATLRLLTDPTTFMLGNNLTKVFRQGKLVVTNLEESEKVADTILLLVSSIHSSNRASARFYEAVFNVLKRDPNIIEILIEKVQAGAKIYRVDSRNEYMRQFEEIINKGRSGKSLIRLY